MSNSLAEELPRQQARCREMLEDAISIGPSGTFLAAMLRADLARAETAAASGDLVAMMRALQSLQEYSE
mgnify:CR=1 FL=1